MPDHVLGTSAYYGSLSGPCFVFRHDECAEWRAEHHIERECGCECHVAQREPTHA
jgi:hypothetical protein